MSLRERAILASMERSFDRRRGVGEPPSEVHITVLLDPDDRGLRERLLLGNRIRFPRGAQRLFAALLVVVAAGAIVATAVPRGGGAASRLVGGGAASRLGRVHARERGAAGVAAVYGYPHRCLSVTISSVDPAFARADFNHGSACGRFAGYATAIFHRAGGVWRPVLEAVSYRCPVAGMPAAVQRGLGVCP